MDQGVLLLEVYEILEDIEDFTLYLKSKFLIGRRINRREYFFVLELMNMLYVEHVPLLPAKELMHLYIQKLLSINTSR